MKYRIDRPYDQLFAVDAEAGVVTTRVSLDREQLASMTFSVVAYDLGVPSRSSTATVKLLVRVEDATLTFDKPTYSFVVLENQSPHTEVGQVTAFDPATSSPTSSVRYDLLPEVAGGADFAVVGFRMNATTGKIYTGRALDRERRAHFRFRAVARGAGHAGTATARVNVHVADLNDNRPRVHWPPPHDVTNGTVIRLSTGAISPPPRRLCLHQCLSVCLSLCLSISGITKKTTDEFIKCYGQLGVHLQLKQAVREAATICPTSCKLTFDLLTLKVVSCT